MMTTARRIEVLSFDGCPNVDLAMSRVREAAHATGFTGEIASVIIDGTEEAVSRKFLGSPSIHVDGVDIDAVADVGGGSEVSETGYAMRCRLYVHDDGRVEGAPALERIVAALQRSGGCSPKKPTASESVDFSSLAAALATAFPRGSEKLFVVLIRLLAEGAPVSRARLANALDWSLERVANVLGQIQSIEYEEGEIVGAALSIRATSPHTLEIEEGRRLYTWCALDALFIPALIGKTCRVASPCAATGKVVRLEVGANAVLDTEPAGAVVSVVTGGGCAGTGIASDLRHQFCDSVRFFVSEAAAQEWLEAAACGGAVIISVEEAFRLSGAIARQLGWLGDASALADAAATATAAPVFACSLPPPELRRRRAEVLVRVRRMVSRIEETSDGFVFGFEPSPNLLAELEEFVRFEAACCSFITMTLSDRTSATIELRMSAPVEAKPFIRAEFVDVAGGSSPTSRACGCD